MGFTGWENLAEYFWQGGAIRGAIFIIRFNNKNTKKTLKTQKNKKQVYECKPIFYYILDI
tara:strand:+ start:204 stop:383 length:180 start_codon:yes stop_codon:yes gene_type:complete